MMEKQVPMCLKSIKMVKIVYDKVLNSGAVGDRNIDENTIFAIHSMTKTVTTVAAMILHEKGLFQLDDPLHKYLPEFKEVKCKGSEGIYNCENKIKVVDILTHRSGYIYYLDNGDNWLTGTHNNLYPSYINCLLYTSPSPRDRTRSRMPSSA